MGKCRVKVATVTALPEIDKLLKRVISLIDRVEIFYLSNCFADTYYNPCWQNLRTAAKNDTYVIDQDFLDHYNVDQSVLSVAKFLLHRKGIDWKRLQNEILSLARTPVSYPNCIRETNRSYNLKFRLN